MTLGTITRKVAELLRQRQRKIVFAESCTGGLVSATLARIPGISAWHCGSLVTYRNATKEAYLGIPSHVLENPGAVSEEVARWMAEGVLQKTPEADLSAAVTGHLGPGAPAALDGVAYLAVGIREGSTTTPELRVRRYVCCSVSRVARQREVATQVLEFLAEELAVLTE